MALTKLRKEYVPTVKKVKRMKIVDNAEGTVHLTHYDPFVGVDISRTFWVPRIGGHVRETTPERPGTLGSQVCERLTNYGNTLYATPDSIASVIRREYNRMRRRYERARKEMDVWASV